MISVFQAGKLRGSEFQLSTSHNSVSAKHGFLPSWVCPRSVIALCLEFFVIRACLLLFFFLNSRPLESQCP